MLIIHDKRMPREYLAAIKAKLPDARLYPFGGPLDNNGEKVYHSIFCHPDIYFFQIASRALVHSPAVPECLLSFLRKAGVELIKGGKDPAGAYPDTAIYNAAKVGGKVLHNLQHTDTVLRRVAEEKGLNFVDVPQAYAACSAVPAGERALITADGGIARSAQEQGIDVLEVSAGAVTLPGEKCGFLGGAAGIMPDGGILFLGDIEEHPDHEDIRGFAEKHGVSIMSLPSLPLYDAGRLLIVDAE